jgi:hypothetical protein
VLRRAVANPNGRPKTTLTTLLWFKLMIRFEGVHPLEGGAFRLTFRRDRRHGMPIESRFVFYPRCAWETARKAWGHLGVYLEAKRMLKRIRKDPQRMAYRDLAITPPGEDEFEALELCKATSGGAAALERMRRAQAGKLAAQAAE